MIIVSGWIDVAPDGRDDTVLRSVELQMATRGEEPGCLAYVFASDPGTPGRIAVHEAWADADALQAHLAHVNYRGMLEVLVGAGITGMEVAKHDVGRSAPVYRPDGVADATWWG